MLFELQLYFSAIIYSIPKSIPIIKGKNYHICDWACENRACGHKLFSVTYRVIAQYWNRTFLFAKYTPLTLTFKVFVLWLCNQHYYTYRDLPYYEDIRAKTHRECILYENKHENHTNYLHTFRKWSITWSYFVLSGRTKCWLI